MKNPLLLLLTMLLVACGGGGDSEITDPATTTSLSCRLTAPTDNLILAPEESFTITGEGSISGDEWGSITLKVGSTTITSVTTLPFSYRHQFDASTPEGAIKISLEVRAKRSQKYASDAVIVRLERPSSRPENVAAVVAQDGSGDYTTVQQAINSLPNNSTTRQVILIKPGTYYEKLSIPSNKPFVTLVGEDAATTILTYDNSSGTKLPSGEEMGTQNSASLTISATDFQAQNLTLANTHVNNTGSGDQAVAVGVYNDRATFYNCRLVGYQDTFYVKNKARVYCKACYIEGNVDFIFGDAVLLCQECQLHCNRNKSVITAAADHSDSAFGFTFMDCQLTHIEGKDFNGSTFSTFYLGRPWKQNARVVFIRCEEPTKLHAAAWCRMSEGVDAALFGEYQCTGEGASADRLAQREMGGRQLTDSEAATYTLENIFSRNTNPNKYKSDWIPDAKIEIK